MVGRRRWLQENMATHLTLLDVLNATPGQGLGPGCVRDTLGSPKGRTELIVGGSGPKSCAENHDNVHFCVAPQKPTKNCKKSILKHNFWQSFIFVRAGKKVDFFFSAGHGGGAGVGARRPQRGRGCGQDLSDKRPHTQVTDSRTRSAELATFEV